MNRIRSRQSGVAMMLVLATVVLASVLGMSYLTVTSVKMRGSENLLRAGRAQYLAESAVQHALCVLRQDPAALDGTGPGNPKGPYYADGTQDAYWFYATSTGPLVYRVTGQATCGGITRTTRAEVRVYSTYKDKLLALGPLYYWRLGDVGTDVAADETGSKDGRYKDGVVQGRPGALAGDPDGAAEFDGVNDHVELPDRVKVAGGLTLIAWFKAEDFAVSSARLISKADGLEEQKHHWMLGTVRAGGYMRLQFRVRADDAWTETQIANSGNLVPGRWTMAAGTFDGTRMRLYKDAVRVATDFHFGSVVAKDKKVWIGGNPSGKEDAPFHGLIDDVAIFNRRLDGGTLEELYRARIGSVRVLSWN